MDRPLIVLFTKEENKLNRFVSELSKYFKVDDTLFTFPESDSIFDWLKSQPVESYKENLFVLDWQTSAEEAIYFLNKLNRICPYSIKITSAEPLKLAHILENVENSSTLIFMNDIWNSFDFQLSIGLAKNADETMKILKDRNREKSAHSVQSNEKLTEKMKALMESNSVKDRFLSIIAHDLKNPFNALLGLSEILIDNWNDLEESEKLEIISDIRKTTEITFDLLINLLEWAKSQQENWIVQTEDFEIHPIIESTLVLTEKNAIPKKLVIKNKVEKGIVVKGDKNMIATVFRNLITNAVKFIPAGGKIEISANCENGFYTFCVADNGDGIEKPHVLEMFKKGSQLNINGNIQSFKGLGLIICKDFVEKNGGKIWLENQKGEGSKFFFTIPCLNNS